MNETNSPGVRYSISPAVLSELQNRYTHHVPNPEQIRRYTEIRTAAFNFAVMLSGHVPASRELSSALTHLDSVMMYANAAIARNERE
jgi:hypothetical protein